MPADANQPPPPAHCADIRSKSSGDVPSAFTLVAFSVAGSVLVGEEPAWSDGVAPTSGATSFGPSPRCAPVNGSSPSATFRQPPRVAKAKPIARAKGRLGIVVRGCSTADFHELGRIFKPWVSRMGGAPLRRHELFRARRNVRQRLLKLLGRGRRRRLEAPHAVL